MCPSRLKLEIQDIRRFDFILIVLQKNIFYFLLFYFLLLFLKYFIFKMKNILSYSIFFLGGTIQFISKNHFLSCNQIILIFLNATFYSISFFSFVQIHPSDFNSFLIKISLNNSINDFILKQNSIFSLSFNY